MGELQRGIEEYMAEPQQDGSEQEKVDLYSDDAHDIIHENSEWQEAKSYLNNPDLADAIDNKIKNHECTSYEEAKFSAAFDKLAKKHTNDNPYCWSPESESHTGVLLENAMEAARNVSRITIDNISNNTDLDSGDLQPAKYLFNQQLEDMYYTHTGTRYSHQQLDYLHKFKAELGASFLNKIFDIGIAFIKYSNGDTDTCEKVVDYLDKLGLIKNEKDIELLKMAVMDSGDYILFNHLSKENRLSPDQESLSSLLISAHRNKSPYDMEKILIDLRSNGWISDGEYSSYCTEISQLLENSSRIASDRLKKMPDGLMTKGLLIHQSGFGNMSSMLNEGILSYDSQVQKWGIRHYQFGHDLQARLGMFDGISVYDPWYGYRGDSEDKQIWEQLNEKIDKLKVQYKELKSKEGSEESILEWEVQHTLWWQYDAFSNPEHKSIIQEIKRVYTETFENRAFREPTTKSLEAILNPGDSALFLINPAISRAPVASAFTYEAFVFGEISPDDLLGICFDPDAGEENIGMAERVAKKYGLPMFVIKNEISEFIFPPTGKLAKRKTPVGIEQKWPPSK